MNRGLALSIQNPSDIYPKPEVERAARQRGATWGSVFGLPSGKGEMGFFSIENTRSFPCSQAGGTRYLACLLRQQALLNFGLGV